MKVVDEVPGGGGLGPKPKYDWDKMLNGQTWELTRGLDFTTSAASFVSYVYKKASERDMKVSIHRRGTKVYVTARRAEGAE